MKKYFYAAITLLAITFLVPQIFAGYSWTETEISRVLSSNVFVMEDDQKSRIIGVLPNNKFSKDRQEACHAKSNSREIRQLLLSSEIFSATDEKVPGARHLKIGKEYVTEIILRNGWAKMSDDAVSSYFSARFKKAQEFAKNHKLGLWAPCPDDLNWQKIRGNFGERMREFKRNNLQFLGEVAIGEVAEVLSGNEFRLKNGPIVKLQNVEIPRENNQASECFQKNSRNYLENLILGKKVRLERPVNSREITDYKLVRNVYLNPLAPLSGGKDKNNKFRGIAVNQKMIAAGFGKFSRTIPSSNLGKFELEKVQAEVYANPRGAWGICAPEILNTDLSNSAKKEEIREIDENCPIKGNISGTKKSPIKTYHTVLSGWYERIQPEQCFQTEEEAIFAGFRKIK
jgi:micrococcal nuclease